MENRHGSSSFATLIMGRLAIPKDAGGAFRVADQALRKARRYETLLSGTGRDVRALSRMVQAWASGSYRDIPWRSIALVLGALVYFLNPLDAIPDPLPGTGYLDDATVIAFVAGVVRADIKRFLRWERSKSRAASSASEPAQVQMG
jgi:uncharacterized membrane protein YkvA (DUF1232 family)